MGRTCFVISPIGSPGSEIRRKADCALEYIIKPAFESLEFEDIERIDRSDEAGQITIGIVKKIVQADWVVADLSGQNPNVFYEIGIRHSFQKPIIHICEESTILPFDNSHQNTIFYLHDDPSSHKRCAERIIRQVKNATEAGGRVTTPVSLALGEISLSEQGSTESEIILDILQRIESLEARQRRDESIRSVTNALAKKTVRSSLAELFVEPDAKIEDINALRRYANLKRAADAGPEDSEKE